MRDDLDIDGNLPDRVRLEVRGPSGRLTRDNLSAVAVVLDLSDAHAGDRTYSIRGRNLNLPPGWSFIARFLRNSRCTLTSSSTRTSLSSRVYVNKPSGYRIASQQFSPTKVRIRGSQDRVQVIHQIRTDPMDLSGVAGEQGLSHSSERRRSAGKGGRRAGRYYSAGEAGKDRERGCPLVARALFGTDGIRGVAGQPPLDPKTAQAVGAALGRWVIESKQNLSGQVVIGMDTRESGPWLAAEVAAGLARHQVKVEFAGVTTTPGVAYLAKNGPFAAGVMISASHNPYQDNGIKLIGHAGYKLPDEQEELLEKEIFSLLDQGAYSPPAPLAVNAGWIAPMWITWPRRSPEGWTD
jgi:hypothetical protein